eukprot:TRINITY_DN4053_c0_g2_i1.p1 TRINITY_DN4053_c0_g2~~TRINITY_DN4053_c0_g2_i1.p1  ORF type:complete len:252 (-),score=46.81 TRINITY_DN4053_c0_g2_i1:106-861(-)
MDEIVDLNIGGHQYTTTRQTLSSSEYFTTLLSGKFGLQRSKDGGIFIDRNGKYFEPILDFLRSGEFSVPSGMTLRDIEREARFFQIQLPIVVHLNDASTQFVDDEYLWEIAYRSIEATSEPILTIVMNEFQACARKAAPIRSGVFASDNQQQMEENLIRITSEQSYPLLNLNSIFKATSTVLNTSYFHLLHQPFYRKLIEKQCQKRGISLYIEEAGVMYTPKIPKKRSSPHDPSSDEDFFIVGYTFVHKGP